MNTRISGVGRARGRWIVAIAVTGTVAAVAIVLAVSATVGARPYEMFGTTDPGAAIRIGTPLLRVLADIAATLCTGALAYAACCTVATGTGGLSPDGYAAVRGAGRAAAVWFVTSLLLVPFSAGSVAGQTASEVLGPRSLLGLLNALEPPKAWLISAGAALVLAVAATRTLRRRPAAALLVLAVFALLPPLATGHSASNAGHDLATAAIMIHVPAAAIWIGVLAALLARARRHRRNRRESVNDNAELAALTTRYRHLAAACWCVLALSGLVEAAVLVPPGALWDTTYGLLVVATVVVTLALGVVGVLLRGRALLRLARAGSQVGAILRVAAVELAVLLVTVGMSATLTHLAPPAFVDRPVTPDETLLGYNLTGPPTLLRLVTDWRVDVLFGPLAVLLAAGYVWGVLRLRRRGEHWQPGRTAAWLAGCFVLLIATSSGIGRYANAMVSVHLASHMLVSMLVPVLLALGGPLTLARSALVPAAPGGIPGFRDWLDGLAHSPPARLLTHPLVALLLFAGSPFLLYFTGVFDAAVRFHWAHLAIDGYFLLVGYAFAWPVIGVDRSPRPLPNLARVGMLLAAMPADIVLGAAIMTTDRVIGNGPAGGNMYSALALPWVQDLLADQQLGGGIALAISEGTLLVAVAALLLRWSHTDDTGTADLPDYERMLLDARR